jgi:MHS family proline/betaine transporter-like MFS transporter
VGVDYAEDRPRHAPLPVLLAASIGNGLEFYSVSVYGFVAATLSKLFFPSNSYAVSLMATFGLFGVSYMVRPIGGFVLGAYADRKGRSASLMLSLQLMVAGTAILSFTPTYRSIGILAPLLVLLARLLQGFALGGEFGSATAYLLEQAPPGRKSLYVSLQFASQGFGGVAAALVGLIPVNLPKGQMVSWGWRLPFVVGLVLGPIGLYVRRYLRDSEEFLRIQPERHPLAILIRTHWREIILSAGSLGMLSANIYLRVYLPSFATTRLGLPAWSPYVLLLITSATTLTLVPTVARYVTRRNAMGIMMVTLLVMIAVIWPVMRFVGNRPSVPSMILGFLLLAILGAIYSAPQAWFISTLFPTAVRGAGLAVSYNIGVLLFGGFAPAIYTWLVAVTGSNQAPAIYVAGASAASIVSLIALGRITKHGAGTE